MIIPHLHFFLVLRTTQVANPIPDPLLKPFTVGSVDEPAPVISVDLAVLPLDSVPAYLLLVIPPDTAIL